MKLNKVYDLSAFSWRSNLPRNRKYCFFTAPPFYSVPIIGEDWEDYFYLVLGETVEYESFVFMSDPISQYRMSFQLGMFPDKVISWLYKDTKTHKHLDIAYYNLKPEVEFDWINSSLNKKDFLAVNRETMRDLEVYGIGEEEILSMSFKTILTEEIKRLVEHTIPEDYVLVDPFVTNNITIDAFKEAGRDYVGFTDPGWFELLKEKYKEE